MLGKFHGKWRVGLLISGLLAVLMVAGGFYFHFSASPKASATAVLWPTTASVGSTITVTGSHLPPQVRVKVYFQNRDRGIITAVTNAKGSFSVPLTVPSAYIPGTRYYVYVNSNVYNTQLPFHFAKPSLSLTDSTTQPAFGSSTSFTGAGFRPSELVNLAWNCATGSVPKAATVAAGSDGSFTTILIIPSIPYSSQCKLVATGNTSSFSASTTLTGTPGLVYDPSSASAGMIVNVTGGSFARDELVNVTFEGSPAITAKTDALGAFTASFTVPDSDLIGYQDNAIIATGLVSGAQAKGGFHKQPKITITPNRGGSGTHIRVAGTRFTHGGTVKVYFVVNEEDSAIIRNLMASIAASKDGTFSVTISAPDLLEDVNSVVAVDGKTNETASTTFFSNDGKG